MHAALLGIDVAPMGDGFHSYWRSLVADSESDDDALRRWRIDAVLAYGDVRRGYEVLRQAQPDAIERVLGKTSQWKPGDSSLFDDLADIPEMKRPLLGYLSSDEIRDVLPDSSMGEFDADRNRVRRVGAENTYTYILAPRLDVYVATSMRRTEDFFDIALFCEELFDDRIETRNIDYFDPTRTFLEDRIEKGVAEGLMLRRALATIYLVQLSDTLGKDSELASTLAQGKPVIAFVQSVGDVDVYANRVMADAEQFGAMLGLWSEDADTDVIVKRRLRVRARDLGITLKGRPGAESVALRIATETKSLLDRRAKTLKERHPLSLQIDLRRGTANGVLVVRDLDLCAELLVRSLTNTLEFDLRQSDPSNSDDLFGPVGAERRLVERLTGSTFRVALGDTVLSRAMREEFRDVDQGRIAPIG